MATAAAQAAARLAELDVASIDVRVRAMQEAGHVSLDWTSYRAALMAQITGTGPAVEALAKAAQISAGPWNASSTVRG